MDNNAVFAVHYVKKKFHESWTKIFNLWFWFNHYRRTLLLVRYLTLLILSNWESQCIPNILHFTWKRSSLNHFFTFCTLSLLISFCVRKQDKFPLAFCCVDITRFKMFGFCFFHLIHFAIINIKSSAKCNRANDVFQSHYFKRKKNKFVKYDKFTQNN